MKRILLHSPRTAGRAISAVNLFSLYVIAASVLYAATVVAGPVLPGGTLNPKSIPKYVNELVIPPEMPKSKSSSRYNAGATADYNIALRQFNQQILPAPLPSTTVWSYGRAEDNVGLNFTAPVPLTENKSFNYPAFTIEAESDIMTHVRWINELVTKPVRCSKGNAPCIPLPHLLDVDRTLHWANPELLKCMDGSFRTDCRPSPSNDAAILQAPYTGPVPMVVHVHGAHVNAESDGYPEAWWLPQGATAGYATEGTEYSQYNPGNTYPGSALYGYENDQPATTLWYHDHTLGMTRLNVYAGPAGFWLVRGGGNDTALDGRFGGVATLPGPPPRENMDPNFDPEVRAMIRDIPIVIQDRSFNDDGSLWYPASRTDFDGFPGPYIPTNGSDISAIWNPEAFFNTMVVNGGTWPKFTVAPALYRFRLLNGSNSRFLNLRLEIVNKGAQGLRGTELPFYVVGSEQGFLPNVTMIRTGFATPLPGNGNIPPEKAILDPFTGLPITDQALLVGPAERYDVIVDFRGLPRGTKIRLFNTGPDSPFGGFPIARADLANGATTRQVMQFVVDDGLLLPEDAVTTPPENLVLEAEAKLLAAEDTRSRRVSLNEEASLTLCFDDNGLAIPTDDPLTDPNCAANHEDAEVAPKAALLGTVKGGIAQGTIRGTPQLWADPITQDPNLNDQEVWRIFNFTEDAHPIHLHLVRFNVLGRFDLATGNKVIGPNPWEKGYKDTVIAYPGMVTHLRAKFDKRGLYVWHCHILEHEDNEMMLPYRVN